MNHAATWRLTDLCKVDSPGDRLLPHPRLKRKLGLAFRHRRKLSAGKEIDRQLHVRPFDGRNATHLEEVAGYDELDPAKRSLVTSETVRAVYAWKIDLSAPDVYRSQACLTHIVAILASLSNRSPSTIDTARDEEMGSVRSVSRISSDDQDLMPDSPSSMMSTLVLVHRERAF